MGIGRCRMQVSAIAVIAATTSARDLPSSAFEIGTAIGIASHGRSALVGCSGRWARAGSVLSLLPAEDSNLSLRSHTEPVREINSVSAGGTRAGDPRLPLSRPSNVHDASTHVHRTFIKHQFVWRPAPLRPSLCDFVSELVDTSPPWVPHGRPHVTPWRRCGPASSEAAAGGGRGY
jgi:hypothetical protein